MLGASGAKQRTAVLATLVMGLTACGDNDGDNTTGVNRRTGATVERPGRRSVPYAQERGARLPSGGTSWSNASIARDRHGHQRVRDGDAADSGRRAAIAQRGLHLIHRPADPRPAGDGRGNERRPVRNPKGAKHNLAHRRARTSSGRSAPSQTSDASPSRVFQARAAGQRPSRTSAMSSGCRVAACSSWGTRVRVLVGPCRKVHGRSMSAQTGSARSAARRGYWAGDVAGERRDC